MSLSTPRSAAAMVAVAGVLTLAGAPALAADGSPQPGRYDAITDVPGVQVGQVQRIGGGYLTGTTVVYTPTAAVTGVSQAGGAPGTKETDLLDPMNSNPGTNAIVLTGGSAFGLDSTTGVMRWLEKRGKGVDVGAGVVPIVPGAVIFDLARGGDFSARPTASWGQRAIAAATGGQVRSGTVGGGTGASAGGLKGGVGTASVTLPNGDHVGAIVVVNAAGSPLDPRDCSLLGSRLALGGEFQGLRTPSAADCSRHPAGSGTTARQPMRNTTIAVVATDAPLEKAAAEKFASVANDGLARAINPVHTLFDGDTVFGMSTGTGAPLRNNDPADGRRLYALYNAGADTLTRAIVDALVSAKSAKGLTSYCDTYPSACRHLQGRAAGSLGAGGSAGGGAATRASVSGSGTGGLSVGLAAMVLAGSALVVRSRLKGVKSVKGGAAAAPVRPRG